MWSKSKEFSASDRCAVTLTFARAASPEAGSGWPMLDLVDPINKGSRFDWQNTETMPFTSCGSPTCVESRYKTCVVFWGSEVVLIEKE